MLDLLTPLIANFPFSSIFLRFKIEDGGQKFQENVNRECVGYNTPPLQSKALAGEFKRSHGYTYYGK